MFLMDTSPLVALQRKWEPFAQARGCRYPVCFSESEDDLARTAMSAKVQVIINNLQSEEASLGTDRDYGCIMQKKQKGAKARGQKYRSPSRLLQKPIQYPQQLCPADSDGMEVEEGSEFGPLSLNSDSDDSVDRDIEAAIQEYLRNKSQSQSLRTCGEETRVSQELFPSVAVCSLFPALPKAEQVWPQPSAGEPRGDGVRTASSPHSTSSDDSFEQSIGAEIEQFLNEKKQQVRKNGLAAGAQKQLAERPAQERQPIASSKGQRGVRALLLKQHSESQGAREHSTLESKPGEESSNLRTCRARLKKTLPSHSCAQVLGKRRALAENGGKPRSGSTEPSDSSSDDGIEEAIQLYQLEKTKKAADQLGGHVAFQKEKFGPGGTVDLSARLAIGSTLLRRPRGGLGSKKQAVGSKPADGSVATAPGSRPENTLARRMASPQVDTTAELMCAEAILDISKRIPPPSTGSQQRPFATAPSFRGQGGPPSQQESDSNGVDSDDSIEQEIRAFLAIKARAECSGSRPREASLAATQVPPCPLPPDGHLSSLAWPSPKAFKPSPNPNRSTQGRNTGAGQRLPAQLRSSKVGHCCGGKSHTKPSASPNHSGANLQSSRARGALKCQQEPLLSIHPTGCAQGLLDAGELAGNASQAQQKYSTGDKSSSLDSDEDLDLATRELLRSKRKLRKKPKDQRIQCKKKVRFSEPEMQVFQGEEKDCKCQVPALLKSCLLGSRRESAGGNVPAGPLWTVRGKPTDAESLQLELECKEEPQSKPISEPETQEEGRSLPCCWPTASLTDESSSMDSDDGIEQEIQKFLAEKAKGSSASPARPLEAGGIEEPPPITKAQPAPSRAKGRLATFGSSALSKPNGKGKRNIPPVTDVRTSLGREEEESIAWGWEKMAPAAKHPCYQAAAKSQAKRGPVEPRAPGFPVKRTPVARRLGGGRRTGQSCLPASKGKGESCKVQNYLKSLSPFKRKVPPEFKISSKFIASLRNAHRRKKKQAQEYSLLAGREGALAANLHGELRGTSLPGSGKEAGIRGTSLPAWYLAEAAPPSLTGNQGKAAATLDKGGKSPAKRTDSGDQVPPDPGRGAPLQKPPLPGGQRTRVGAGHPQDKVPAAESGGRVPGTPGPLPLKAEPLSPPAQRAKVPTAQIVPEEAPAKLTHMPVVACAHGLVKCSVSNLVEVLTPIATGVPRA